MSHLLLPDGRQIETENVGAVSDSYHTFEELYDHRCLLFLAVMAAHPNLAWTSEAHSDGSVWDGWFIAGMHLPTGDITYHLPEKLAPLVDTSKIRVLNRAPEWDGHTSQDVIGRLTAWLITAHPAPAGNESEEAR